MVVTMLGISIYAVTGARREWIAQYWRRTVRGFVARFYLSTETGADGKQRRKLAYMIITRREDADFRWRTSREPGGTIAISLPLGGWFAQSWILGHDRDQIGRLQGWSVRLRAILNTHAVMVEIRKHNRFWSVDERIVTDIGSALRHLEEIAMKPGTPASISDYFHWKALSLDVTTREREELERRMTALFQILHDAAGNPSVNGPMHEWMETELRRLTAERDAARNEVDRYRDGFLPAAIKHRDAARQECREAVAFIMELDQRFEESSRLHDKIQALKIHERIAEWLYETIHHHVDYAAALDRIRARLKKEERRDRRRHGKGATPATT